MPFEYFSGFDQKLRSQSQENLKVTSSVRKQMHKDKQPTFLFILAIYSFSLSHQMNRNQK